MGYGLYRYTFENQCREIPGISLGDEAIRIFFNTRGTNGAEVSPETIELLRYIEHTTEEVSRECKSERIKDMQKRISAIKSNEEIGVKYMQEWEEKIIEKRRAREEGLAEGRAEGRMQEQISLICKKIMKGQSMEQIADALEEDISYIENICKVAEKYAPMYDVGKIYQEICSRGK